MAGYSTREIFNTWVKFFAEKVDATPENPFISTWDGHDSHWDADMLSWCYNHSLIVVFLRANASITDQPNDNGINAKFKAAYKTAYLNWRDKVGPSRPITRPAVNEMITAAYNILLADTTLRKCIVDAFMKTRLFPLA